MQPGSHSIARDMGAAIAVLAMYLLMLLAPWHQAAALQHDLAALGYASAATIDICTGVPSDTDDGSTGFKCPIAGVVKFAFAGIVPGSAALDLPRRTAETIYAFAPVPLPPALAHDTGQPRGPPGRA